MVMTNHIFWGFVPIVAEKTQISSIKQKRTNMPFTLVKFSTICYFLGTFFFATLPQAFAYDLPLFTPPETTATIHIQETAKTHEWINVMVLFNDGSIPSNALPLVTISLSDGPEGGEVESFADVPISQIRFNKKGRYTLYIQTTYITKET